MLLALIPSDTWDIRSPSRQWWRLKLKQASHFSSPRSNGSLRTGLQPCGLHKILWWRSSAKEKYYIHIRFGQITKKKREYGRQFFSLVCSWRKREDEIFRLNRRSVHLLEKDRSKGVKSADYCGQHMTNTNSLCKERGMSKCMVI